VEIGEPISTPSVLQEFEAKCPFTMDMESGPANAPEEIPDDDKDSVQALQANSGGILGDNLTAGTKGVADGGPFPADDFVWRQPANDSKRGRKTLLRLDAYMDAQGGDFPFTVAAHHLIPGNASLYDESVGLVNFMKDGGKIKSAAGKEYTIKGNIGYDVNGSHNAVWLPGNYAIQTELKARVRNGKTLPARAGTTPTPGKPWRDLHEPWQFDYVAGACKAAGGQFHDTHELPYSATVRKNLNRIVYALAYHLDECPECSQKNAPVPPPFRIKRRLYALSAKLRGYVTGPPAAWKKPWFTSERWSKTYFSGGKLTREFRQAYAEAKETVPEVMHLGV
jgi:hypothetical protein